MEVPNEADRLGREVWAAAAPHEPRMLANTHRVVRTLKFARELAHAAEGGRVDAAASAGQIIVAVVAEAVDYLV